MLFAESSDAVQIWTLALSTISTLFLAWIGYLTLKLKDQQQEAAVKVEEVRVTTASNVDKLDIIGERVEQVHVATNSMKDALVVSTEKEALLRGASEERIRAAERQDVGNKGK